MPDAGELIALAERCEAATGMDRELDLAISKCSFNKYPVPSAACLGDGGLAWSGFCGYDVAYYSDSIDAAATIVPDEMEWKIHRWSNASRVVPWLASAEVYLGFPEYRIVETFGARNPALALCAAALRARAAQC